MKLNPKVNDRVRSSWRLQKRASHLPFERSGLRPGLLIYVVMTAGAAVGSTGALRRRMAAEMRVTIRPTGRGSMKVSSCDVLALSRSATRFTIAAQTGFWEA